MKKIISVLLVAVFVCLLFNGTVFADTRVNFLRTHVESVKCVAYDINSNSVEDSERFNEKNALDYITDGDKSVQVDVYGALDWEYPKYIGVLFTLEDEYLIDNITITSGAIEGENEYPDTYRVYAGTSLEDLYTSENMVADDVVCLSSTETISLTKKVKYIAFFCTDYVICQRIKELEAWGNVEENIPDVPSVDDMTTGLHTVGTKFYMGATQVDLRGVNVPQFSWSSYGDGTNVTGQTAADRALNQALNEWNCSIIRLAVDPSVYVNGGTGYGGGQSVYKSAAEYQALIDRFITSITNAGVVAILDCHGYGGVYQTIVDFWNIAAPKYDDNELVMYGLLNEPTCNWEQWFEGGYLYAPHAGNVNCIGLPALLDKVRAVSDNVVVIGGIDYAFDLSKVDKVGFAEFAASRAPALGISVDEYTKRYSLSTESRKGRGIVLDSHIYSGKPVNWDYYIGRAAEEFPIVIGEYNPYFRSGALSELTDQEEAYLQKIFHWITSNGFASTSWSLGAEPFLTDLYGEMTAIGVAVKEFVQKGKYTCDQDENLIYQHYAGARAIGKSNSDNNVFYNNTFINQAHSNGSAVGNAILTHITDGEISTQYDIYAWDGYMMGVEYQLDNVYPCHEIRMTSGADGYPDKYKIYASDTLEDLYSAENLVEDLTVEHTGTVAYKINKPVKYVAFLGEDYVRIKEFSLSGVHFGDMNADSRLSASDLTILRKHIIGVETSEYSARGDINCDGSVDIRDIINIKKELTK